MIVTHVCVGDPRPNPTGQSGQSGIHKAPVAQLEVGYLGAQGDFIGNTRHHGGPCKALLAVCGEHYEGWRQRYPNADWSPGAFGENLTVAGLDEAGACLGDIYEVGTTRLQISQPRSPCAKLSAKLGIRTLVEEVMATDTAGWYWRVLQPGTIRPGDALTQVAEHADRISIAEANRIRFADPVDRDGLARLLAVDVLAEPWRVDLAELWGRGR